MDSSPSTISSPSRRLEAISGLIAVGLFAVALTWLAWAVMPQQRKTSIHLMLLRSWRRALSQHARHTAALSMARELATGQQDYEQSYRLALAVDRIDGKINMVKAGL